MNAGMALGAAAAKLRSSGSFSPRLDAELLLGRATGWARETLLAHPEWEIDAEATERFERLVARRERAEPMAYLLGERDFYGRMFFADDRALIPRPETELLVELGIAAVDRWRALGIEPRVVEIGTGAGAIAVSVALERQVEVLATDVSAAALGLARDNAVHLGALNLVRFEQCNLLDGIAAPVHVLLANLPYIPNNRELPSDVKDYEPHVAIFGGPRGTELIERLLEQARDVLAPGGEVCVELDEEEQAQPVAKLARELYGATVDIHRDAGGYDRVVRAVMTA